MSAVKQRLKEPSTWAGLGVLAAQAVVILKPEWAAVANMLTFMFGGGAVVMPERERG